MPISKRLDHPERRADSGVSSVHRQPERTYRRDRISALFYCLNRSVNHQMLTRRRATEMLPRWPLAVPIRSEFVRERGRIIAFE